MKSSWLYLLGALALGAVLLGAKKAMAYANGKPIGEIELGSIGGGLYLRADVATKWNALVAAAKAAGIVIKPSGAAAAFRFQEDQERMLRERGAYGSGGFAAKLGFSPHQAGYAVDVANMNPAVASFDPKARAWMDANASRFDFWNAGATFSTKEPWHWEHKTK